jgi:hypothetical protein
MMNPRREGNEAYATVRSAKSDDDIFVDGQLEVVRQTFQEQTQVLRRMNT